MTVKNNGKSGLKDKIKTVRIEINTGQGYKIVTDRIQDLVDLDVENLVTENIFELSASGNYVSLFTKPGKKFVKVNPITVHKKTRDLYIKKFVGFIWGESIYEY